MFSWWHLSKRFACLALQQGMSIGEMTPILSPVRKAQSKSEVSQAGDKAIPTSVSPRQGALGFPPPPLPPEPEVPWQLREPWPLKAANPSNLGSGHGGNEGEH